MDSNIPPVLNYSVSVTREGTNMINNYTTSGAEISLVIPGSDFPEVGTYSFSVTAYNGVEGSDPVTTSAPGTFILHVLCSSIKFLLSD